MEKLIREAVTIFNITKDFSFILNVDDRPASVGEPSVPLFHFSSFWDDCRDAFPDFMYDGWPEIGIPDYEVERAALADLGEPLSNKIGWIGAVTCYDREVLLRYGHHNRSFCDFRENTWNRKDPSNLHLHTSSYMTMQDQARSWKYLFDIKGAGWSARLKLLLASNRIVFMTARTYREWFFPFLEPWVHFIPVSSDFADFEENYRKIEGDLGLQKSILQNQRVFAEQYCSRRAALCKIADIINSLE